MRGPKYYNYCTYYSNLFCRYQEEKPGDLKDFITCEIKTVIGLKLQLADSR